MLSSKASRVTGRSTYKVKTRRGFTLIELLVVIAIIAILAAILFPVFLSAKKRAMAASCQSNMKQCASAMLAYSDDWSSYLPMGHWGAEWQTDKPDMYWGAAIKKYCASKKEICYCPGLPPKFGYLPGQSGSGSGKDDWQYYWGTSIGMNLALGMEGVGGYVAPCRTGELRSSTKTIMLGDSSSYQYTDYWKEEAPRTGSWCITPGSKTDPKLGRLKYINPVPSWFLYDMFDPNRHDGKINIAFVDGHVGTYDRDWLLVPHAQTPNDPNFTWWDRK